MTTAGDLIRITSVTVDTPSFIGLGSVWPVRHVIRQRDGLESVLLANPLTHDKWEQYPVLANENGETWEIYS